MPPRPGPPECHQLQKPSPKEDPSSPYEALAPGVSAQHTPTPSSSTASPLPPATTPLYSPCFLPLPLHPVLPDPKLLFDYHMTPCFHGSQLSGNKVQTCKRRFQALPLTAPVCEVPCKTDGGVCILLPRLLPYCPPLKPPLPINATISVPLRAKCKCSLYSRSGLLRVSMHASFLWTPRRPS